MDEKCKLQKSLFVENTSSAALLVFHVHQCSASTWDGRTCALNKQVQLFEVFSRRSQCARRCLHHRDFRGAGGFAQPPASRIKLTRLLTVEVVEVEAAVIFFSFFPDSSLESGVKFLYGWFAQKQPRGATLTTSFPASCRLCSPPNTLIS